MFDASRAHLAAAGETYFEHMRFALVVGLLATGAGLACIVHALVPSVCQQTCSRTVALLQYLFADRRRLPEVVHDGSGVATFVGLLALSGATTLFALVATGAAPLAMLLAAQAFLLPLVYLVRNPALEAV